ncbi:MAG: hypothetical protein Q9217_000761 [Psora testacea]
MNARHNPHSTSFQFLKPDSRTHSATYSYVSIEAWLEQTKAETSAAISPFEVLNRKRSPSLPLGTEPIASSLTKAKLRNWTRKMTGRKKAAAQKPSTGSIPTGDELTYETTSDPSTTQPKTGETPISKSSSAKSLGNARRVGKAMQKHGLWQDDKAALSKYPTFERNIRNILGNRRHSHMKETQTEEFQAILQNVHGHNEDTVLQNLVPLIIKRKYTAVKDIQGEELEHYTKKVESAQSDAARKALEKESLYTHRMWSKDGLVVTMKAEFCTTLLPNHYMELGFEAKLVKLLAKDQGMTNPKPDYCYGLSTNSFPIPRGVILNMELDDILEIAPGMLHPFLIIEGKADRGEISEAQNQACRGGATLVNAGRILLDRIGVADVDGPDERTIVFSATMNPTVLEIWIHWAEVTKTEGVKFHMNKLVGRLLDDAGQLVDLRRKLHNILAWGCNTRRKDLEDLHEKLYDYQRQETRRQLHEANGAKNKKRKA